MANVRSTTATFKADTSGFTKGTNEMIGKLNELNKQLVNNQYRQKDCNKAISDAQKKLKEVQAEIDKTGKADEEQTKQVKKLNDAIEEEKLKLAQLKTEQASLKQVISETSKEIANSSKEIADNSKEIADSNKEWTVLKGTLANLAADGIEAVGAKLLQLGKDVIQTGEQFSASMSEVGAISGATAEELELLEQTAREYGATTKFSATESAQALKYMALAGWDVEQSTAALGGILDLAAASGMDLAAASDMVTDYLSAFGMEAQDAAYMADLLTYAQGNSNTSAQQLGEAYSNCAANMSAAGQDIETTTALLEAMANQGLKGSQAGTAVAAMIRDITDKMENGKIMIGSTAVAVQDINGDFRDMTDILTDVDAATQGMGTAQKAAALSNVFTANSIKGVNLVLNEGVGKIADYEEALRNSTGAAQDAAATMSDNLSGDIKTMESALDELKLKLFDDAEQPVRNIVKLITTEGVAAMGSVIDNLDKVLPALITCVTALGSLKAALAIKELISGLTAATVAQTVATEGATVAQEGLNLAMDSNVIGAVCAALGLLIGMLSNYAMNLNTAAEATDIANDKALNYLRTLNNLKSQEQDKVSSALAEAETIKVLKGQYDELRTRTSLNADATKQLDTIANDLANTLGISVSALRDESGAYRDLTADIDDYISKLKEQIRFEGAKEQLTEAIKAADQLQKAYDDAVDAYEEQAKKVDELSAAWDKAAESGDVHASDEILEQLVAEDSKLKELNTTVSNYYIRLEQANAAIEDAEERIKGHTGTIEENTDANNTNTDSLEDHDAIVKAVTDSLDTLNSTLSILNKVEKEVSDNGKISLNTLNELVKKYPQLTDAVSDYISGVRTEADVIAELKKVYEKDLDDYIKATNKKASITEELYSKFVQGNADLIDKYKEQYDIDISNYATAAAAKIAIQNKMYEKMVAAHREYSALTDKYFTSVEFGQQVLYVNDPGGGFHPASAAEIEEYNRIRNNFFNAQHDYDYAPDEFEEQFLSDAVSFQPSGLSGAGTSGTGASGTGNNKNTVSVQGWGTTASGSSYTQATLTLLNRAANLGTINDQQTIAELQRLLTRGDITNDEIYSVKHAIKQATERIEKAESEALAREQQQYQEQLDLALAAYEKLVNDKIDLYKAEAEAAQKAADAEIAALDAVLKKRKEEQADAQRKAEIDKINARLEYDQLDSLSRYTLEKQLQNLLNEQAEIDFERDIERQKAELTAQAAEAQNQSAEAIAGLQAASAQMSDHMARLAGTQSNSQIVNNNNQQQNISIIQNALTDDQVVDKLMRLLYDD